MSSKMQLIMENWNRAINRDLLLNDKEYVENVLGMPFSLHEAHNNDALQEQLLLEGFFDNWEKLATVAPGLAKGIKAMGLMLSNKQGLPSYMALIDSAMNSWSLKIKEKIKQFPSILGLLDRIKTLVNTAIMKYNKQPLSWRKGLTGLAMVVGVYYVFQKLATLDPSKMVGQEMSSEIKTFVQQELIGWFKNFIGEETVGLLVTLGASVGAGGVYAFIMALGKLVGGTEMLLTPLLPVFEKITKGAVALTKQGAITLQENTL